MDYLWAHAAMAIFISGICDSGAPVNHAEAASCPARVFKRVFKRESP